MRYNIVVEIGEHRFYECIESESESDAKRKAWKCVYKHVDECLKYGKAYAPFRFINQTKESVFFHKPEKPSSVINGL